MVEVIRERWKGLAVAAVGLGSVFGFGLPADFVDYSTKLVVEIAVAGQAVYMGVIALRDYATKLLEGK